MKFQTITVILVFLLIGISSVSLSVTVSAATTATTAPPTTTTPTASPTTTVTTPTTVPTTTVTTLTTAPTTPATTPITANTTVLPTSSMTVLTTLPTPFITNVTFQTPTPLITQTLNPAYTPATYPIDTSTTRTPDIDAGMPAYDGPVPTPTTVVETVTPTSSSTPLIVVPVNTTVETPIRTIERLENISNVSPYQTYTPAPTPAPPNGPDLLKILLLAVLAIAGGAGIALLSRSYRGRQGTGEDVSMAPVSDKNADTGEGEVPPGAVPMDEQATLDQIADYDPETTESKNLMQMLDGLVQNSQKSLHNPTIRLDDLIRLSGIATLPIPERVAQWGADHGYVVVSRDFQNEALLFRQTPAPGEPDLGIIYIGDLIGDNDIPSAPKNPGKPGNL